MAKQEIKLGYFYKNSWGDIRIPIYCYGRDVFFVEKINRSEWLVSPYNCRVTVKSFMDKFFISEEGESLNEKQLKSVSLLVKKSITQWCKFMMNGHKKLSLILTK